MMDTKIYHELMVKLRHYFSDKLGYVEVPAQSRLSILAACEDPHTISQFIFAGINYPLPQTGQMWLERELLENPDFPGVFCATISYRDEPHPITGRHDLIFPMFEFESRGDIETLISLEGDLLKFLGLPALHRLKYSIISMLYKVPLLEPRHEEMMRRDYGDSLALFSFPKTSHPFWNMKRHSDGTCNKVDVILFGMETIGSAERSCDQSQMLDDFYNVSDGEYSDLLFSAFGKDRVLKELDEYLNLEMTPRFGGGIGLTRLARAFSLNSGNKP